MASMAQATIEVNSALVEEVQRLRTALECIINQQPCTINGDCFYPMHDGEGTYIGEQNVDPLSVIQSMAQIASEALCPNDKAQPRPESGR